MRDFPTRSKRETEFSGPPLGLDQWEDYTNLRYYRSKQETEDIMTTEAILRTMRRRSECTKNDLCTECRRVDHANNRSLPMLRGDLEYTKHEHGPVRGHVWFLASLNKIEQQRWETYCGERRQQAAARLDSPGAHNV